MILKTTEKSENTLHKCSINSTVGKLLVEQLSNELYNKLLYEDFANYYASNGLVLLERYYRGRANEEEQHYQWIKKFLNDNDYKYSHPEVNAPAEKYENLEDPFKLTVDVEVETTEDIYTIYETAVAEKDWITAQWLMSDDSSLGNLIKEQAEEMNLSRTALEIAQMDTGWPNKERTIWQLYSSK